MSFLTELTALSSGFLSNWSFDVLHRSPAMIDNLYLNLRQILPANLPKIGNVLLPAETSGGSWKHYDVATADGK